MLNYKIATNKEKIIDTRNMNNYGILFWDYRFSEALQNGSGMDGNYSVEYQMHYIAARGRIKTNTQILDVAIPLACVHYEQDVSGAAIEFDLRDVTEATEKIMEEAIKKFKELSETDFMKKLKENGFVSWEITPMNSIHTHPGSLLSFSGVDYRKDINNPGVVFPLSSGSEIANFASIQIHAGGYAELGHTEYRLFTEKENGDKVYEKGRCLTLVRGYEQPEEEPPTPGPIDEIFGIEPEWKKKPWKRRDDKIIANEMPETRNKDFERELMTLWKECDFEPDYSQISAKNIFRYRRPKTTTTKTIGYQPTLFKNGKEETVDMSKVWALQVKKKANWLIDEINYTKEELQGKSAYEINQLYDMEYEYWEAEQDDFSYKHLIPKVRNILIQDNIITKEKLDTLSNADIKRTFEESYHIEIDVLESMDV